VGSAAWRREAEAWLDRQLAGTGRTRTGPVTQPSLRPWATVLSAPATGGTVWLKAGGRGTRFEAGLYALLHEVAPDRVLEPIALDVERGWMLLPDGGAPLGDRLTGDALVAALERVLPAYGQLQRDLAPHADRMLALGVSDMRPAAMPERLDEALAAVRPYVERHADAADRAGYDRVAAMRQEVEAWCRQLAAAPGAPSLDHNDLHPHNLLDGARFYDWGDSVVAHPFASMLLGLGFVQRRVLGSREDAPEVLRLRDAYLEPFGDLAPHAELVAALELACRVGKIVRALTWQRAVAAGAPEDWGRAPLAVLNGLADESHLSGWWR
jgi:hypothetical protein